jgi:hypothetical protein
MVKAKEKKKKERQKAEKGRQKKLSGAIFMHQKEE